MRQFQEHRDILKLLKPSWLLCPNPCWRAVHLTEFKRVCVYIYIYTLKQRGLATPCSDAVTEIKPKVEDELASSAVMIPDCLFEIGPLSWRPHWW